jgi:hypothetical protein
MIASVPSALARFGEHPIIFIAVSTLTIIKVAQKIFDQIHSLNHPHKNILIALAVRAVAVTALSVFMIQGVIMVMLGIWTKKLSASNSVESQAQSALPAYKPESVSSLLIICDRKEAGIERFIEEAIKADRPDLIRQLVLFLFHLPAFQEDGPQLGLAVYLQEKIMRRLCCYHKSRGDLLEHIFCTEAEVVNLILNSVPSLNPDVASIVLEYNKRDIVDMGNRWLCPETEVVDAILTVKSLYRDMALLITQYTGRITDAEGRFRICAIVDGGLVQDLQQHPDPRIQAYIQAGTRLFRGQDPHPGDDLSKALQHTPSFKEIDFTPFITTLSAHQNGFLPLPGFS